MDCDYLPTPQTASKLAKGEEKTLNLLRKTIKVLSPTKSNTNYKKTKELQIKPLIKQRRNDKTKYFNDYNTSNEKLKSVVITIQKWWRMHIKTKEAKLKAFKKLITNYYKYKVNKITYFFIGKRINLNIKYYALYMQISRVMNKAAIKIQSYIRMYLIRKQYSLLIQYERLYTSIKWSGEESLVEVVGSFTNPPWKLKLKLDYCAFRRIFIKYLANLDLKKEHYYFFIINGATNYKKYKLNSKNNDIPLIANKKINNSIDNPLNSNRKELSSLKESPKKIIEDKKEIWTRIQLFPNLSKDYEIPNKVIYKSSINEDFLSLQSDKGIIGVFNKDARAGNNEGSNWLEDNTSITNEDNDITDNKANHSTVGINFDLARDIIYENYY